eukprot:CAMPEP_0194167506 /NCGR_PEP_ID=MMETSP0154-20130528/2762_1 /TAXON_ID=1049557 /ORGANISM="Thalassiothrix antarctica, Strain L6-D1" /LENGTH=850 /DNA_ID=CAMNT_0038878419 /DNA_START=239 /DNA_END=2787 /DNA_ORIENTATION=-
MIPSNQELVEERLRIGLEKKENRLRSKQNKHNRHMEIKRLLHTNTTNYTVPDLYAVKISVCKELREDLKLNAREKRGRFFLEKGGEATTLRGLKKELHEFFRALKKSTYCLEACLPIIKNEGMITPNEINYEEFNFWKIERDDDVIKMFRAADSFYTENEANMKRPSISLHVTKDPNAPVPPPLPEYLKNNMPDPIQTANMTMLSFYAFPPSTITYPDDFALQLKRKWKPFHALGRVYVAKEGVNAQMSVPSNVVDRFMECCKSIPELGQWMENGINIDPISIPVDEFATAGVPVNGKPAPPFRNLHIRVRSQVVADGLNDNTEEEQQLDWQSAGYDMPPLEWHQTLKEAEKNNATTTPILLDCRNKYETDMGKFENAEPLNTDNFRESWDVIEERLLNTPKDTPIMMYCTGGIRCVKVGAYVTQKLGFANVSRLAGGIIAYDRKIQKEEKENSIFKGTNFVFDGRLGRTITDDDFAECITCGERTSLVTNCFNDNCHKRMTQCEKCRSAFMGTCSDACRQRVVNVMLTNNKTNTEDESTVSEDKSSTQQQQNFDNLEDYSNGYSTPPPSFYCEVEFNTQHFFESGAHMISGESQGRLLTQLASLSREGRVLEIGTFTGYSTACLLEGVANAGEAINFEGKGGRDGGPYVMTLERDPRALRLALAHLKIMTENGIWEDGAEAACGLRGKGRDDLITSSSITDDEVSNFTYNNIAGCDVVKVTDALATVEAMANDIGESRPAPFDIVFIDADKTRLLEYVDALLVNDLILKKGGLILVDNVLWKGLVLEASASNNNEQQNDNNKDISTRKGRRARKLANKMHKFNTEILKENRVEVLVLPIRDGLSVIRKR